MSSRFLVFVSIVTAVLSLSAAYVGIRLLSWSAWAVAHAGIVWLALGLFVLLQLLGPFLYRVFPNRRNRLFVVHWVTYTALGVFGCMFFYTLAADVVVGLWALVSDVGPIPTLAIVSALVTATVVIGAIQAAVGARIYEVEIALPHLPAAFDGFRIVQITDMHLGPTLGRRYAQRSVDRANALAPDVVALTGDFVDGSVAQLHKVVEPLAHLKATHGTFFVTGNHEYYWGVRDWIKEFQRLGARVLMNEHVSIRRGASAIVLAGVPDHSAGRNIPEHDSDPQKAIAGAPDGAVKILLAHHPASYRDAARAGFDLQISGHTHGGQFFPFSLLVRLTHRYYKGLKKFERLWIYVSRGTGYWGPPLRFGVPAEITLIKLKRV